MTSKNDDVTGEWGMKMYREHPQLAIIKSRYPNVTWLKSYFKLEKNNDICKEHREKVFEDREILTWKDFYKIINWFDACSGGPDKLATISDPNMVIDIYELLFITNGGPIEERSDKFKEIESILEISVSYGNVKVSDYLYTILQEHGNSTIFEDCHYYVISEFDSEEMMIWAVEIEDRLPPFIFKRTDECVDIFRRHGWSRTLYNDNLYIGQFIIPEHGGDSRDRNEIVIERLSHIYRNYDFYERHLKYEELDNIEKFIDTIPNHSVDKGILAKTIYEALPDQYKYVITPYMEKHGIANTMIKSANKK